MPKLKSIHIYPIKSMQGLALQTAEIDSTGLKNDRIALVTKLDGTFITARTYPALLSIQVEIDAEKIMLHLPNATIMPVYFSEFEIKKEPTEVWGSHFSSSIAPTKVNQLLSEFLNEAVQLRWIGEISDRFVQNKPTVPLACADGAPYLLLNQASFDFLQAKCPEKLIIERFRGNLIIDDASPFIEDEWSEIKIGDILFDVIKPCDRCIMTTIDPITQQFSKNKEPLSTLRHFRQDAAGDIDFGMMLLARNQGTIKVNDPVTILKTQPAKQYVSLDTKPKVPVPKIKKVTISYQDKTFVGNTHDILLEQCESAGITLPYGCRVGICGQCRTHLESGQVEAKTSSAIKDNGDILPCSCVPLSDLKLNPIKK